MEQAIVVSGEMPVLEQQQHMTSTIENILGRKGEMPTISVVMPVYNAERYVAEAVESILSQTFADFEFLIIDDGSTDRSLEILEKYAQADQRVKLKSRPNTGYVVALNEMLHAARGEFIARMDADDVSLPDRFEWQLQYLRSHERCMVVGTATEWIDPDGALLRVHNPPLSHQEIDSSHMTSLDAVIFHPTVLIRTKVFEFVREYDERLFGAEDYDLWLRIAEIGEVANLAEPLLRYRFHFNKVCFTQKKRQLASARAGILAAYARRNISANVPPRRCPLSSKNLQLNTWAWWALGSGNVPTARKYAWQLILRQPYLLGTWRLAYCAIRGY